MLGPRFHTSAAQHTGVSKDWTSLPGDVWKPVMTYVAITTTEGRGSSWMFGGSKAVTHFAVSALQLVLWVPATAVTHHSTTTHGTLHTQGSFMFTTTL